MKKLSFFLMSMLFSVVSFAETYSLTPNKAQTGLTNTSYITTLTGFEYNGVAWKMNQWNPSSLQVKTNQSSAASEWRFYNTSAFPGKITKVVIKFSALTLKNTSTSGFKFVGGTAAVTATSGGTDGVWNATAKTLTWTPNAEDNFTYFALYQNGKVASGTNNLATSDAIVVTYEAAGGSTETIVKTLKSIAVEGMTTTYEQGDIFKFDGTCTATYSVTKNDEPQADETKTVTPTVSVPNMNLLGTQTITVSYTDDEETVSTTYDINITENTVTPGTYTGNLNNTFFGCAAGNNSAELSGKFNDILVVASCKENAQNKTYYDAAHVRFYADTYLKISVPEGYAITSIQLKEPTSSTRWDGSISVDKGTYTEGTKSWSGYEQEVQFSFGKQNRIASITVTYELLDVKHIAVPIISGETEFVESTEISISAEDGLKVYYTLDGTDPTNASTEYTAPFTVSATTTVKAVAYDGENASDIASQTFKKLQVLTCEEAAELCADTESADKYVIRGYVTNVKYAYNEEHKTATFWIADTKDGGQVLQAYSAKPVAEIDKAVKVGDYVEAIGNLKLYYETPEITNGTYTIIPTPVVNHTITVSAGEGGSVTGLENDGVYAEGTELTLTATPADHYVFVNWTKGEEVVSTENPYTFNVTADVDLVANFAKKTYTVTATAENGSVEGIAADGKYEHGAEATLTATPAEGYEFVKWTENEVEVSTDAEYTFEVLADRNLVANFKKKTYTVTANATNGTVTGAGTYNHGEEVTLTATPAFDYEFVKWSNESTENPLTITVTDNETLEAIFAEVAPTEKKESGVFSISAHKTATFATGNLQYHTGDKTWRFAKQQYQVVGEQNINLGDPAFSGWIDMLGWSTNDEDNNFGVNPSNVNELYDGEFVDWGTKMGAEWSTLSADDWKYLLNTREDAATLKQIAKVGDILGLLLFPDGWVMPVDVVVDAEKDEYFEVDVYNYTLEQWTKLEQVGALFLPAAGRRTGGYGNMINYDQVEEKNEEMLNGGYYRHQDNTNIYCYYWTSTINEETKNVSYLHNIVALGNEKYTIGTGAVWGEKGRYGQSVRLAKVVYDEHEVIVTAENGTVTGAGEYTHGAEVTLTATANEHYVFVNWTKGEEVVAETAEYTFTIEADVELVANFKLDSHTVAATAENGTVEGAGTYEHGAEVTLTATAAEGYEFVNWTVGEETITENPYKFTVTADVNLVANFKEKVVAPTKLYLAPNAYWKQSNARFAAYFFGNGDTWVSMTKVAGETDLYEVTIPTDKKYPNVIFCRMNPSASANNWNDGVKWNQTADLVIPTDGKNHYTVKEGTWDKGGGTWSIWPVPVVKTYKDITITVIANATPKIHYWEGGDKMVGSNWENKPEMVATGEENTYSYTIKDVDEATGVKYLVVVGDIQSADQITSVNVTKNFKEFLPQVAVQGVNNWDGTDKMTVSDDYLTASITLPLAANKAYELKLTVNGDWFGGKTIAITKDKNSAKFDTNGDGNGKITTDLAGGYVFTYTYATKTLTVAYPVSVTANAENGTVEGAGTYTHGTEVTLTAIPATGYKFRNWTTANSVVVSTEATYTFIATADVELIANFYHETTIHCVPAGDLAWYLGQALPGDTLLLADGIYDEAYSIAFDKEGLVVIAAEGAKPVIELTGEHTALNVSASTTFDGITFDGTEVAQYIIATLDSTTMTTDLTIKNCEFKNWTLWAVSNQYEKNVSVNSVVIDNCLFHDGTGAAISFSNNAPEGKQACEYFEMTNSTLYKISESSYRGIINVGSNPEAEGDYNTVVIDHITMYDYTLINSGIAAIAIRKTHNLKISNSIIANPEENGKTALNVYGGTVDNTIHYNGAKRSGSTVYTNCDNVDPLFVDAANGNFVLMPLSPARGAATDGSDLGDPRWYTSVNKYTVTATANPAEAGTVSGADEYIEGVAVTLVATPERGYSFVNWTVEGEEVSTDATYTFTPSADIELVANFEEIEFTGNIINVEPGAFTLSAAIEAAQPGDMIVLADGEYSEEWSLQFNKEGLIIKAAEGAKPVVKIGSYAQHYATTTIIGIVFDGKFSDEKTAEHGIYSYENTSKSLTLIDCEIKNVANYIISSNSSAHVDSLILDGCLLHDCGAAAIYMQTSSSLPETLPTCSYFSITNSTVYNIFGTEHYGAIDIEEHTNGKEQGGTEVIIDHVTLYNFTTPQGGIRVHKSPNTSITNTIVANPTTAVANSFYVYGGTTVSNSLQYNCEKRSSSSINYVDIITADPMFTHAEHGIFCLKEGSPAIGAATDDTNLGDPRWNTPHYLVELSVLNPDHGTVEGAGVYKHGETVTVVAYAKPDYKFAAWIDNNDVNEEVTDRIYSFEITGDVNLQAAFEYEEGAQGDATDIENNIISNSQVMKVIQNGRLFIIREGKIYNAQGQVVK